MTRWFEKVRRTSRIEEIGEMLDALPHGERVKEVRSMCGATQALLWEMAERTEVTLDDLVPPDVPSLTPVIHYGKNSLPLLSSFEKRFCRPAQQRDPDVLYGYNEGVTRPLVGPGYFMVRATPGNTKGSVVIDYYMTPSEKPVSWPEISTKDSGIPAVVYGFMHDYLRKVSSHVTIGRAFKHHKVTSNYFLLCREDV
jgi:hypothetical protein